MTRAKPLTPADLRKPGRWGRPVRTYPTFRVIPPPASPAAARA